MLFRSIANMPMVGKKKFPYTAKGKAMAKKAAKKAGKKKAARGKGRMGGRSYSRV